MKKILVLAVVLCMCSGGFAVAHRKVHHRRIVHHLKVSAVSVAMTCTAPTAGTAATGFNFYRSTTAGSGYVKLNSVPVTSCAYTDLTVSSATTYYYVATGVATGMCPSTSTVACTCTGPSGVTSSFAAGTTWSCESAYSAPATAAVPAGLAITTASLPAGTVGTAYSVTLAVAGGIAPYSWTDTCTGACNTGLNLSNGVLSGTPTTAGSSTFTFTVTDSGGITASASLAITIGGWAGAPNAPTGLTIGKLTARNRVPLEWKAPAAQSGYVVNSYAVMRNTKNNWAQRVAVKTTSYTDSCSGSCSWEVEAVDSVGGKLVTSAPSNVVSINK